MEKAIKIHILTMLALLSNFVPAAEVDYTQRGEGLTDISVQINERINRRVRSAIAAYNQDSERGTSCNKERLTQFLSVHLDTNLPEAIVDIYTQVEPMQPKSNVADTIYANVPTTVVEDIYAQHGACCYPPIIVRSNTQNKNVTVGLDKVDHFLSNGFSYYTTFTQTQGTESQKLNASLDLGIGQEEGMWGLRGTGVKSYGDMAANYGGLLMYRDLLDGRGANPAGITCNSSDGTFSLPPAGEVDIRNYATQAWDEGTNCSSFKNVESAQAVAQAAQSRGMTCPIRTADCMELKRIYPEAVAAKILSGRCLQGYNGELVLRYEDPAGLFNSMGNSLDTNRGMEGLGR